MRKIVSLCLFLFCAVAVYAQAVTGTTTYQVDTIFHRQIGPGVVHTRLRLPEYPLNVYLLEVDMTQPYNRVETTQAYNTLGKTEKLENAHKRHEAMGKTPIAACNASFWCVSDQIPWYNFMPGVPHGAEVVNDTIYTNTSANGLYDFNGGSVNTASTIITKDKRALVGRHEWYACAKSDKFSGVQEIKQVNKLCDYNQLVLFNHARGRNHTFFTYPDTCDYVFLNFKKGEKWGIAQDMKFEVAEVKTKASGQVLGDYDACLIADGPYKDEMRKLAVGDEVTINTYWFNIDGDRTPIAVENMTEGEAHVMLNGQITNRANGDYGAMIYSRTAYGSNADGTKLYMIVIDKSTHPQYGKSAGCTATTMCKLWKSLVPDLCNAANMDAGGSAQMMVDGSVVNYTTEGVPRAVANGMMIFSTAQEEGRGVISELKFMDYKHEASVYSNYAPKVLGYNKYGELISEDVEITYTCSENVGAPSADGKEIEVGANACVGTITAHYNGVEVTAPIFIKGEGAQFRLKSIVIDNAREYPIEIVSMLDGEQKVCNASRFTYTVGDETIVSVENGVLKGLKEGMTTVTASLGDFSDETTVKVEIAKEWKSFLAYDGWTMTSTKLASDATLSADGVIKFGYEGTTNASFSMAKDVVFYSLPDHLYLDFTTTTILQKVEIDVRSNLTINDTEEHIVKIPEKGRFAADTRHTIDILPLIGDVNELGIYPIILKKISFFPFKNTYTKGENTINLQMWAEYINNSSGVDEAIQSEFKIAVYPNPVIDGRFMVSAVGIDTVNVGIYNVSGSMLYNKTLEVNGGSAVVAPELSSGMYYVKVEGDGESIVKKIIIK